MTDSASMSRRRAMGFMTTAAVGLSLPGTAHAAPADVGAWSPVHELPIVPIHLHLLPNGKVCILQDDNELYPERNPGSVEVFVVDVASGQPPSGSSEVVNDKINLFCSGHTFMADGRLFFTGGHRDQYYGESGVTIFDYRTNGWVTNTDLPHDYARWYGSAITLSTGEVLTVSGTIDGESDPNELPQVWSSSSSFRNLTGAVRAMANYPSLYTAPNGRVFRAGPEQQCLWLSTGGNGQWSNAPARKHGTRKYGPTAMYDTGRIIALGGGLKTADDPTNTAEIINLNATSPAWRFTSSMRHARRHANAVVLPDGKVLVVGGTSKGVNVASGRVLAAELWSPGTGTWTLMASMRTPRLYHSTAILLPDARVLVAGGGRGSNGVPYPNCEIFSPPYLFKGPRPSISAPGTVSYGATFSVSTPQAASIAGVCLIRLGSVTHTFNMNQRRVSLSFTKGSGSLSVSVPTNRSNVPPGHYMLFAVNTNGVPSVASIVRVG
jgi:hypothetical protein